MEQADRIEGIAIAHNCFQVGDRAIKCWTNSMHGAVAPQPLDLRPYLGQKVTITGNLVSDDVWDAKFIGLAEKNEAEHRIAIRSAHSKLDPLLRITVADIGSDRVSDIELYVDRLSYLGETEITPLGAMAGAAQPLLSQMLPEAGRRLIEEGRVGVLINSANAEMLSNQINAWENSEVQKLTVSTLKADIPISRILDLASLESVRSVEADVQLYPHCDFAHVSSNLVESGTRTVAQTGEGILIGIVDTGLDANHEAFKKNGKTRVVFYQDQTTGQSYTVDEIDQGLAATDQIGHGTHVAGIAAGNGSPGTFFAGVAPDADLAIVKTDFVSGNIATAVKDIFDLAESRDNQPCVVNLSLGGRLGGHDGTTVMERTIDELSGPGRIVVVSAGNEGSQQIHASTSLPVGDEGRWVADFEIFPRNIQGNQIGALVVQIWHQHEDEVNLELRTPTGELLKAPQQDTQRYNRGGFIVDATHRIAEYSGDNETAFSVHAIPKPENLTGWSVVCKGINVNVGAIHAWIGGKQAGQFTTGYTRSHLIGMPGTAYSAITVASYATRNSWRSLDPARSNVLLDAVNIGDTSYFSSPGPTRDGDTKPEIAAPGQMLIAPLSSSAPLSEIPLWTRINGSPYAAMQGTSMAAPYVTGAVALLLQKAGKIDWAEVKRRLIKSAHQDRHTSQGWNMRWGYGKIDVKKLLEVEPR